MFPVRIIQRKPNMPLTNHIGHPTSAQPPPAPTTASTGSCSFPSWSFLTPHPPLTCMSVPATRKWRCRLSCHSSSEKVASACLMWAAFLYFPQRISLKWGASLYMAKLYNSEAQHGRFQAWKDHTPLRSSFHKTQLPSVLQSLWPTREGTTCYGKIKGLDVKLLSSSSTSSFRLRNYMALARRGGSHL